MTIRLLKIKALTRLKRGWRLDAPVPRAEVDRIEARCGFLLPEEYRGFILRVGNGGIIPSWRGDGACRLMPFEDSPALQRAGQAFPLTESWEWDTDLDFSPDDPADREKWERVREDGIILLAAEEAGGVQAFFLVVSGPCRGEVWERDENGVLRLPGCTFLDWVELSLSAKLMPYTYRLFRQAKNRPEPDGSISLIREMAASKRRRDIRWNPPATADEVRDFERRHGIELPAEYVAFITEIGDGCENFPCANSRGEGGIFYSLKQLDGLTDLDKDFSLSGSTDEPQRNPDASFEPAAYTRDCPVWKSLSADPPGKEPPCPAWVCAEYSVLRGVLPFASYNDEKPPWRDRSTQPVLILGGPLKGQVWRATAVTIWPDSSTFFGWVIKMLRGGAL